MTLEAAGVGTDLGAEVFEELSWLGWYGIWEESGGCFVELETSSKASQRLGLQALRASQIRMNENGQAGAV